MTQENQFAAMANYFRSMLTPANNDEALKRAEQEEIESKSVALKEYDLENRAKLERIIEQVKPETAVVTQTQTITQLTTKEVQEQKETTVVEEKVAVQEVATPKVQDEWTNIDVPEDFQALFFVVNNVTFAVPLLELGGISNMDKITSIIGKPSWFKGMMNVREDKFQVVDFVKWAMPQASGEISDFSYLIELSTSKWGITCHQLIGTESLHRSQVQWRSCSGKRPWLAGLVKDKRCALIHVKELIKLFEKGINIDGN